MIAAIKLDKDISCENICQILGKTINDYRNTNNDLTNSILVIDIKTITDDTIDTVPKLEYKN